MFFLTEVGLTYFTAMMQLIVPYANNVHISGNYENPLIVSYFGSEQGKAMLDELSNIPVSVTRLVIDEGVTSLADGYSSTGAVGKYMITIPSTLSGFDTDQVIANDIMGNSEFASYRGYGLIVPPAVEELTSNTRFGEYLQYIGINAKKITSISLRPYINNLFIGNSVEKISDNAINVERDLVINIDNTREFVEANWDTNWLNENGYNVTINYLR